MKKVKQYLQSLIENSPRTVFSGTWDEYQEFDSDEKVFLDTANCVKYLSMVESYTLVEGYILYHDAGGNTGLYQVEETEFPELGGKEISFTLTLKQNK